MFGANLKPVYAMLVNNRFSMQILTSALMSMSMERLKIGIKHVPM